MMYQNQTDAATIGLILASSGRMWHVHIVIYLSPDYWYDLPKKFQNIPELGQNQADAGCIGHILARHGM